MSPQLGQVTNDTEHSIDRGAGGPSAVISLVVGPPGPRLKSIRFGNGFHLGRESTSFVEAEPGGFGSVGQAIVVERETWVQR
jgi:hypothetical protein